MSQGRSSATFARVIQMLCLLVLLSGVADAVTYTVGGASGWTFNVDSWPIGKRFSPGDALVFNYTQGAHNVVRVSRSGHDSCNPSGGITYSSGSDRILLSKGASYFICGIGTHCESGGMKIGVYAS